MNNLAKNFIFLSQITGIPVIDFNTGRKAGYSFDLAAGLREMYPRVTGLIVRAKKPKKNIYVPWKNVKNIIEGKAIFVENTRDIFSQNMKMSEGEILLRETFWDKQIVDISGSKVVRVNDLHLLKENLNFWVVHMDVGIPGILRRLGWLRFFEVFVDLVSSCKLENKFISWKFVQPISSNIGAEALALKVRHSRLSELHPADVADIVGDLGTDERIAILNFLDNETAANIFQELPMKIKIQLAEMVSEARLISIINGMAIDESVDLLSQLSKKKAYSLLHHMPSDRAAQISDLLKHPTDIAGSIMNTEFVSVKQIMPAAEVMDKIKNESKTKESIYYIYALDENNSLSGVVTLRQLLTCDPQKPVSELMRKRVTKVRVSTNVKDVAEIFYKYDFTVVPVVDKENKIQGIITMKDAFEAVFRKIKEETEEIK